VSQTGPPAEPPASAAPTPEPENGRAAHVISQLYYYVVAVIGVALVLSGVIRVLFGIRTMILPQEFQQARDGVRSVLHGLTLAIPGALLLWWHLREALRREGYVNAASFWGRSLYFHLVALVSVVFVVLGAVLALSAAADLAVPNCPAHVRPLPLPPGAEPQPGTKSTYIQWTFEECFPAPAEAARRAVDGAIFILASGPVWWWHLRQGRMATAPVPSA
jgi:uncharacterized protein DUF5671